MLLHIKKILLLLITPYCLLTWGGDISLLSFLQPNSKSVSDYNSPSEYLETATSHRIGYQYYQKLLKKIREYEKTEELYLLDRDLGHDNEELYNYEHQLTVIPFKKTHFHPQSNITYSDQNIPFHTFGGTGNKKEEKATKDIEQSSTDQKSKSNNDTTKNKERRSDIAIADDLKKDIDEFIKKQQFHNVAPIIDNYMKRLSKEIHLHENMKYFFDIEHLDNPAFTKQATHEMIKQRFPDAYQIGKVVHLSIDYDTSRESIQESLLHAYLKNYYEITASSDADKLTLFKKIISIESKTNFHIVQLFMVRSYIPLVNYFLQCLPEFSEDEWKIYTVQSEYLHLTTVFIRKRNQHSYRILFLDSNQAFRSEGSSNIFSPESEIIALALLTALDQLGAEEAKFFYLPGSRQVDLYTCPAFVSQDVATLLQHPMIPSSSYFSMPAKNVLLSLWSPVLETAILQPATLKENNQAWKNEEAIDIHTAEPILKNIIEKYFRQDHSLLFWNSDQYTFHQLLKFPTPFLFMTQGINNLQRLVAKLSPEEQESVKLKVKTETALCPLHFRASSQINVMSVKVFMELAHELILNIRDGSEIPPE